MHRAADFVGVISAPHLLLLLLLLGNLTHFNTWRHPTNLQPYLQYFAVRPIIMYVIGGGLLVHSSA